VIRSYATQGTRDVFDGTDSKAARRACPRALCVARRKLDQFHQAHVLDDLRVPPANHLEKLKGNRAGQHSIRINEQYRVCFVWTPDGPDAVAIVNYHR